MGKVAEPLPAKLIMPMFSGDAELFELAERALPAHFGPIDYRSPRVPFDHTTYYEGEFGSGLERMFLSFESLIDPSELAGVKLLTNEMELRWAKAGHRRINLDPGYVTAAKLVLATTKNREHRIYLGQGIYAEITLIYRDKNFRPLPWTYPDYRSEAYIDILRTIRGTYMRQLKALRERG